MPHCSAVSSGNGELVAVCVGDAMDGDGVAVAVRDTGVREAVRVAEPLTAATALSDAATTVMSARAISSVASVATNFVNESVEGLLVGGNAPVRTPPVSRTVSWLRAPAA